MRREDSNARIREILQQSHEIAIFPEFCQVVGTSIDYPSPRKAVLTGRVEDRPDSVEEILRIENMRFDFASEPSVDFLLESREELILLGGDEEKR